MNDISPNEHIVNIQNVLDFERTKKDSLYYLLKLTNSPIESEIGMHGPLLASISIDEQNTDESLHLFETLFGRDSLYASLMLLDYYPNLAKYTLIRLSELQGTKLDILSEEEPGKILHEYRENGDVYGQEFAKLHSWKFPYYGSVDATLLYISLLNQYCKKNGYSFLNTQYKSKAGQILSIYDGFLSALNWIKNKRETNKQGFIEHKRLNPHGIENQMWKDSWDSFSDYDGSIPNPDLGTASLIVQGLLYDALVNSSEIYKEFKNNNEESENLINQVKNLKKDILEFFYVENSYFCIGLGKDTQHNWKQLKVKTSDMGHLLNTFLFDEEDVFYIDKIVENLFHPNLLSSNGIRTLANDEFRYKAGSYHNGSVWPWDNYYISLGLEKHGYFKESELIRDKILNIVQITGQYPEFIRGDESIPTINKEIVDIWSDKDGKFNRIEQPPQQIQAWTVCAVRAIELKRMHNQYISKNLYSYYNEEGSAV